MKMNQRGRDFLDGIQDGREQATNEILDLPVMKIGERDGNKWYKTLCKQIQDNMRNGR